MASLLLALLLVMSTVVCATTSAPFAGNVCGGISPLTRWATTARSDTIKMNVDTSHCQFENVPLYFTSITGTAGHYLLVGVNAIYEPTQYGFSINVHSTSNETTNTLMAWSAMYHWDVNWFGFSS